MDISIYKNGWIVPAKCGSRHLDEVFGILTQIDLNDRTEGWDYSIPEIIKLSITEGGLMGLIRNERITHIVLRDPLSSLHAALHTDLWGHISESEREAGLNRENRRVMWELSKYMEGGTGHWSPHWYESVWWFLQFRPDVKIVLLSELNRFIQTELGRNVEYKKEKWDFSRFEKSRKEIIQWLWDECPDWWGVIWYRFSMESYWWDRILKRDKNLLPLPKVKPMVLPFVPKDGGLLPKVKRIVKHNRKDLERKLQEPQKEKKKIKKIL